jgi:hypothetical protein
MSAKLLSLLRATSGDSGKLSLLTLEAEPGVVSVEPFDEENERRLRGVYGVEFVLSGVAGDLNWSI